MHTTSMTKSNTIITILFSFIFSSFILADPENGCELDNNTLFLTSSGSVFYKSDADIAGFQFTVVGTTVSGTSGGDAADAGFTVQGSGSTILGFSFTGSTIPAGCGTLVELSLDGEASGLNNIVMSDADGQALEFTYYEDSSGDDDGGACDDLDGDGICDDVDDCVGELDECGVCNGNGIADGDCDCDGNVDDECGVCGGDGSSCDDGGDDGGIDDGCNLPANNLYLSDGNVLYNSDDDISGFQFNVDGADVVSASGGDAAASGFTISNSSLISRIWADPVMGLVSNFLFCAQRYALSW